MFRSLTFRRKPPATGQDDENRQAGTAGQTMPASLPIRRSNTTATASMRPQTLSIPARNSSRYWPQASQPPAYSVVAPEGHGLLIPRRLPTPPITGATGANPSLPHSLTTFTAPEPTPTPATQSRTSSSSREHSANPQPSPSEISVQSKLKSRDHHDTASEPIMFSRKKKQQKKQQQEMPKQQQMSSYGRMAQATSHARSSQLAAKEAAAEREARWAAEFELLAEYGDIEMPEGKEKTEAEKAEWLLKHPEDAEDFAGVTEAHDTHDAGDVDEADADDGVYYDYEASAGPSSARSVPAPPALAQKGKKSAVPPMPSMLTKPTMPVEPEPEFSRCEPEDEDKNENENENENQNENQNENKEDALPPLGKQRHNPHPARAPLDLDRPVGPINWVDKKGKGKANVWAYGNREVRVGSIAHELELATSDETRLERMSNLINDLDDILEDNSHLKSHPAFRSAEANRDLAAAQVETAGESEPHDNNPSNGPLTKKKVQKILALIGDTIVPRTLTHPKACQADIFSALELEEFYQFTMSYGHQDRKTIISNNTSLRIIKNELESLLARDAITDAEYGDVMAKLPPEQPLNGAPIQRNEPQPTPTPAVAPPSYAQAAPQPALPARRGADPPKEREIDEATALYDYKGDAGDCEFKAGDLVSIYEYCNAEWCKGRNKRTGAEGLFPFNYVRKNEKQEYQPQPYGQPQYGQPQPYGGPSYAPPQQANPYNSAVPPMAVANGPAEGNKESKGGEMGKKFGKKLGNAAIFGAGATIGGNIVNSIF